LNSARKKGSFSSLDSANWYQKLDVLRFWLIIELEHSRMLGFGSKIFDKTRWPVAGLCEMAILIAKDTEPLVCGTT
jgi:hypothetical protein